MIDFYVYQDPNYALGNFVNCTPTILRLYETHKKPIPVMFGTRYVAEAYEGSEYITHISSPKGRKLFGSDLICRENIMPDYEYIQMKTIGKPYSNNAFVPVNANYRKSFENYRYSVLACGSGSDREDYVNSKTPDVELFFREIESSKIPVIFIGSDQDYARMKDVADACSVRCIGNIQECIACIDGAEMFIGNDTGFAHVAGALKKPMRLYWKDTKWPKNANTNLNCEYIFKDKWKQS